MTDPTEHGANHVRVERQDEGGLMKAHRTDEGFLFADAYATKAGVFHYTQPDGSVRKELRLPEEVGKPDSLGTLGRKPVTLNHPPEDVTPDNWPKHGVGMVGERVTFRAADGFVCVTISVARKDAIESIETGLTRELSCGYSCEIDETPGVWEGEQYDVVQRNIRYNHLAIVDRGRAGSEVHLRLDQAGLQLVCEPPDQARLDAFPNEHAARVKAPTGYTGFARKTIAPGVSVVLGIVEGKSEVQSYRFAKESYTAEQAREWLVKHEIEPIEFEPATKNVQDGIDLEPENLKPTEAMIAWFDEREQKHVESVRLGIERLLDKITSFDEVEKIELKSRARSHDASKTGEDERIGFIWNTHRYQCETLKTKFVEPDGLRDLVNTAVKLHKSRNRHHPEYHENVMSMTDVDLAELAADWVAVSNENGASSARDWLDESVDRFKFTDEQVAKIARCIDIIEEAELEINKNNDMTKSPPGGSNSGDDIMPEPKTDGTTPPPDEMVALKKDLADAKRANAELEKANDKLQKSYDKLSGKFDALKKQADEVKGKTKKKGNDSDDRLDWFNERVDLIAVAKKMELDVDAIEFNRFDNGAVKKLIVAKHLDGKRLDDASDEYVDGCYGMLLHAIGDREQKLDSLAQAFTPEDGKVDPPEDFQSVMASATDTYNTAQDCAARKE